MMSDKLKKAREYELAHEKDILPEERPAFHLSPRVSWLNDPNGFSWYGGQYHLFYQYHPYSSVWGPMHWGHAVSRDLVRWEYLPAIMAPDTPCDSFGVFSGTAEVLPDGRQLLMYTGVHKEPSGVPGKMTEYQVQCIATGDGLEYEKFEGNPVLTDADIPAGSSVSDFRDPKIWRKSDGTYASIVSNRDASGSAQLLLYTSPDGFRWKFSKVFCANNWRFGNMWECPDFALCDGKALLFVSPMEMLAQGTEYPNGRTTICLIGSYDEETDTFTGETDQIVDSGIDFYASQTTKTPDGRTVMVGWMANWDVCEFRQPKEKWYGMMTLPRELTVRDNRLYQQPVRELEQYRRNPVQYRDVPVSGEVKLDGVRGRCADLVLTIRPGEDTNAFSIRFAQDDKFYTCLTYCPREGVLKLDRRFSGSRQGTIHQRECLVGKRSELKLRLVLDRFSVEAFVGEGERTMTATFFTDISADGISFVSDGTAALDVEKYDLEMNVNA